MAEDAFLAFKKKGEIETVDAEIITQDDKKQKLSEKRNEMKEELEVARKNESKIREMRDLERQIDEKEQGFRNFCEQVWHTMLKS